MMLCQICKANPATIHIQEIVNGETNTLHICAECAKKRNLSEGNAANSHFHEMLERLTQAIANSADLKLAELFEQKKPQEEEAQDVLCNACGTSWQAYKKNGKLGCAACYEQFGQLLIEETALDQQRNVDRPGLHRTGPDPFHVPLHLPQHRRIPVPRHGLHKHSGVGRRTQPRGNAP